VSVVAGCVRETALTGPNALFLCTTTCFERIGMAATGELIRMMNFVDDIAATLRRINSSFYLLSGEEKKRLAEYMRKADPNFLNVIEMLEKGE
jgi:hypothetical protein